MDLDTDQDMPDAAAHRNTETAAEDALAQDIAPGMSIPEQNDHSTSADPKSGTNSLPSMRGSHWDDEGIQELAAHFLAQDYDVRDSIPLFARPPPYETVREHDPDAQAFSMMRALTDHPDILIMLVTYLDLPTLISLYAIDRRFHFLFNSNYVAYIRASLRTWAPGSEEIFPWTCYRSLCVKDPVPRPKLKWMGREDRAVREFEERRDVPGLRWLQMVIYRDGVCKDIMIQLALQGLRCPRRTSEALKRMWFLLDLPLNAHRIALIRSREYMPVTTLTRLTCFFIKLDMFFTRPSGPVYPQNHRNQRLLSNDWAGGVFVGNEMREYMLAERNLTPLWRVLHGWSPDPDDPQCPMTRLDVLRMWVRHKYTIPDYAIGPVRTMSVMGVPWYQIGMQRYERTGGNGRIPKKLLRPDELVMLEGIRRKLSLHKSWVTMMTWNMTDLLGRPMPIFSEEEMNRKLMAMKI